jgi:hypothetical protein
MSLLAQTRAPKKSANVRSAFNSDQIPDVARLRYGANSRKSNVLPWAFGFGDRTSDIPKLQQRATSVIQKPKNGQASYRTRCR